ncbi:MAG: AbrB/MazE/SpoVT family DNA-binding domain-containing protein [Caldilineaceae bacterium]|nr:AbrB/MazE/SpoVT family DNA-binding domain-containing protein [Caldilineaceae bacterium]
MSEQLQGVEVQVGPQGRLVIPASLRRAWQIERGQILIARLDGERLVLEKPAQVLRRVKGRFAALRGQPSLADELIAERRAEARREAVS